MAYSNFSLFAQLAALRRQLQDLENKLDGEHADGPNINLSINELTSEQAVAVAGNEPTSYPSGNGWFFENEVLGFQLLDKTQPNPKFNFYTHSYNTNLNDLTIGQCKGLVSQFTVKDITSGEDVPAVVIFYAVYTKPKFDGTDMSSWYNSRLVISNSATDERVNSNIVYTLEQDSNSMTKKSSSFSPNDEILMVSIQSNSSEPVENWKFKLEYLNVMTFSDVIETKLRIEGDKKQVFSVSSEFQGLLSDLSYPFSFGYGTQSSSSFGYAIPFNYRLAGYTLICDSLDASPSVVVEIESVPDDGSGIVSIINKTLDSSKKLKELFPQALVQKSGLINIKVVSVAGCVDELARYRCVLFLKSDVVL